MKIETLEIHNFKVLQNVKIDNIGSMAVFLGENGAGKTTLFDVLGFIKTCLKENIRSALQVHEGYAEVHSRGTDGDIEILFTYRVKAGSPVSKYGFSIGNFNNKPVVKYEYLEFSNGDSKFTFHRTDTKMLDINIVTRKGLEWVPSDVVNFKVASGDDLALAVLGKLADYPVAIELKKYIEDWFIFDLSSDRSLLKSDSENLDSAGRNLNKVLLFIKNNHPDKYDNIVKEFSEFIPNISGVETKTSETGRIFLEFYNSKFKEPFNTQLISDGTLKLFTYLVLLAEPNPHKLLCIEEPENKIYPEILQPFAESLRIYSHQHNQVFIATHSPEFVNALEPHELFIIRQLPSGFSEIKAIADNKQVVDFFEAGDKLGWLWNQNLLNYWPEQN
jgi:predicted ATPase